MQKARPIRPVVTGPRADGESVFVMGPEPLP
jgi:hypothetical protein